MNASGMIKNMDKRAGPLRSAPISQRVIPASPALARLFSLFPSAWHIPYLPAYFLAVSHCNPLMMNKMKNVMTSMTAATAVAPA